MPLNTTFIFVHISKTAGTTFNYSYLAAAFPDTERFVVSGTQPQNREDIARLIALRPAQKRRLRVIAGHNTRGLGEHFENAKYLTLFRHPYQQVLSFYLHSLHHDPDHEVSKYM